MLRELSLNEMEMVSGGSWSHGNPVPPTVDGDSTPATVIYEDGSVLSTTLGHLNGMSSSADTDNPLGGTGDLNWSCCTIPVVGVSWDVVNVSISNDGHDPNIVEASCLAGGGTQADCATAGYNWDLQTGRK